MKQNQKKDNQKQNNNESLNSTLQKKKFLREQAKQLLLKGCYLMAANNYSKLIQMNIDQFPIRQQAIIYLNCGICYQFMSQNNNKNFIQALNLMKKSLTIDKSYQKTYYRLLQLLRDHQYYQTALNLVPPHISNSQIQKLLIEIRQLYVKKSSVVKMLEDLEKKQTTLVKLKAIIDKITANVLELLQQHINLKYTFNEETINKTKRIGSQIELLYRTITNYAYKNKQSQNQSQIQLSKTLINQCCQFFNKIFSLKIDKKSNILIIDMILEPFIMEFKGSLVNYLADFPQNIQIYKNLNKNSQFLNNNSFVKNSGKKLIFFSEISLLKFVRLVDVNIQLFCQAYSFLSDSSYKFIGNNLKTIKQSQNKKTQQKSQQYDNKLIHKFIASNYISAEEVVQSNVQINNKASNNKNKIKIHYGGHCQYLYKNISINELNLFKKLLQEQSSKLSKIYSTPKISKNMLEHFHEFIYSIDNLMTIFMSLLRIYYSSKMSQISVIMNQISDVRNIAHLISIRHWEIDYLKLNKEQQLKNDSQLTDQKQYIKITLPSYQFNYNFESFLQYFQTCIKNQDFIAIYLYKQIFKYILKDKNNISSSQRQKQSVKRTVKQQNSNIIFKEQIIETCISYMDYIRFKAYRIRQKILTKQIKDQQNYVYKEIYLLLLCTVLKIDVKRDIVVDYEFVIRQIYNQDILLQVSLQCLLLILLNKPTHILQYLKNYESITKLIKNFLTKPLIEQIQPFGKLLNVIYYLVCDFQSDQQKYFSKKLGVSQKQVHQARLLQKQITKQKQNQREIIIKEKKQFIKKIADQGIDILNQLCKIVRVNLKMDQFNSIRLCKIIFTIAQVNHKKLYSSQIIEFMLQARKINELPNSFQFNCKQSACKFFMIICKKCNIQIFEYKYIQQIVDSLLWLIKNCEHQLVYFESLLGLVNLSTASVRIPIEEIEKCFYEQNSYIVHAGVCVMNNILIYNEQFLEDEQKGRKFKERISDIIIKYVQFYRDQITNLQCQLPETDYSHPKKIYNSLISLATVLKLNKLQELQSWQKGKKYIKFLGNIQAIEFMFKLVIYFSLQGNLPRNWNHGFQNELIFMQQIQPHKYSKLKQLCE